MNVATITMPPHVAREKMRACRTNMHRQVEGQYEQLLKGYEALEKGTPLIDISTIWPTVEFDAKMRPRIAICRADRKEVEFRWEAYQQAGIFSGSDAKQAGESLRIRAELGRFHGRKHIWVHENQRHARDITVQGFAPVPMIPPDKIPAHGQRREWHILWEVEAWADRSKTGRAPVDPFLLKHLGGALYAVLASWDLTPLEQAIMNGALRA